MGELSKLTEAQQTLVIEYIAFATRMARNFHKERRHLGYDLEDIEGAALLGLCDAARRFDPSRGAYFQTFCYFRVRGAMYDLMRHGGGIPKRVFNRIVAFEKEREQGRAQEPVSVSDKEKVPFAIARTLGELISLVHSIDEINIRLHVNADSERPEMTYAQSYSPEQLVAIRNAKRRLRTLIALLPEDQQRMIELKYFSGLTFEEMSHSFGGNSKTYLSRLHYRALDALKDIIVRDESYPGEMLEEALV